MPKIFCSEFQSNSIKIEDFKINPINHFNLISTKGGGVNILSLFLGMSYNMPKMLSSKFQSPSIKVDKYAPWQSEGKTIHRAWPFGPAKKEFTVNIEHKTC